MEFPLDQPFGCGAAGTTAKACSDVPHQSKVNSGFTRNFDDASRTVVILLKHWTHLIATPFN
jgi:hypothetical protein